MPSITYVHPDGAREALDVPVGTSVMRAAILNGVDGIVAECGGEMMCATCHVYVERGPISTARRRSRTTRRRCSNSPPASAARTAALSCQLVVTAEMDGLVVHLPETQV